MKRARWLVGRGLDASCAAAGVGVIAWWLGASWGRWLWWAGLDAMAAVFLLVGTVVCICWQWESLGWTARIRGWLWQRKLRRELAERERG